MEGAASGARGNVPLIDDDVKAESTTSSTSIVAISSPTCVSASSCVAQATACWCCYGCVESETMCLSLFLCGTGYCMVVCTVTDVCGGINVAKETVDDNNNNNNSNVESTESRWRHSLNVQLQPVVPFLCSVVPPRTPQWVDDT